MSLTFRCTSWAPNRTRVERQAIWFYEHQNPTVGSNPDYFLCGINIFFVARVIDHGAILTEDGSVRPARNCWRSVRPGFSEEGWQAADDRRQVAGAVCFCYRTGRRFGQLVPDGSWLLS